MIFLKVSVSEGRGALPKTISFFLLKMTYLGINSTFRALPKDVFFPPNIKY